MANALPKSWSWTPIVELLDENSNGKPFQQGWSPQCHSHPAPYNHWGVLKTTAIQDGDFWDHENKELPESTEPRPHLEVFKGDILMTCAGPRNRCGVVCFVKETRPKLLMSGKMYRFRPNNHLVDSRYLEGFIRSHQAQRAIDSMKTGISDSGLNLTHGRFSELKIPFAPFPEQKRIVAKIEELFSELDNGIAALKTAREQLKVYRQAVLKHAFEGKLTEKWREENAADAWCTEKLGDLIAFLTSGSRGWAKYYSGSGDIFIRAQNLKYDRLDLIDKAYVSLPEKTEGKRTQVQFGDLLITITGANVTKTGIVDRDIGTAYVSQHVALCRLSERVCPEFLYWFLVAEAAGRRQLSKFAYGAGKPGLNLDNIRSLEINLPSLEEQLIIVANIKEQLSIEENLSQSLEEQIQRSELIRQSILKKAFSGQLVTQDLSDEPASELLARIQAEREATKTKSAKKARKAK